MQGQTIPFKGFLRHPCFGTRARTVSTPRPGRSRTPSTSMNSAQYFERQSTQHFEESFSSRPGRAGRGDGYDHRKLYSEHRFLADMLPVSQHLHRALSHKQRRFTTGRRIISSASRPSPARWTTNLRSTRFIDYARTDCRLNPEPSS